MHIVVMYRTLIRIGFFLFVCLFVNNHVLV
jgi:hypothetical protein